MRAVWGLYLEQERSWAIDKMISFTYSFFY